MSSNTVMTKPAVLVRKRRKLPWGRWLLGILATIVAIIWAFPIYWMINSSLQSDDELYGSSVSFWPKALQFDNYAKVFQDPDFWNAFKMSAAVTAMAVSVALILALFGAAALTRFQFRGSKGFIVAILVLQMIPGEALFISQFRMLDTMDLISSAFGLAFLYAGGAIPITIWLLKGFIDGIPADLEEAAQVDGCGRAEAFIRVTMPLLVPGFVASGIFAFLGAWNEYTLALVIMKAPNSATLPLWLRRFTEMFGTTDWGGVMAGSAVVAIPVIILFLLAQSRMTEGMVGGAVKG